MGILDDMGKNIDKELDKMNRKRELAKIKEQAAKDKNPKRPVM